MLDIGLNNSSLVDTLNISVIKSHNGSWCFDIKLINNSLRKYKGN